MVNEALIPEAPFSIEEAVAYLRAADPILATVIDQAGPYQPRRPLDPYAALIRAIFYQQLAGPAAAAIQRRFFLLYGDAEQPPEPPALLTTPDESFRSAGVSRQKVSYLRDLATQIVDGRLDLHALPALPDAEVISRLTAVRGVGEWSAQMFLMFNLGRPDVLPVGDLGLRRGMRIAYGLDALPTATVARQIGAAWSPFRTVGSWYMWRVTEPAPNI